MKNSPSWRLLLIPVAAIVFLALDPQIYLWLGTGSDWKGSYAVSNYDEVAYSAYVNALINGKPRRHDPFMAQDTDTENLYSIQFIPAYAVAGPARVFGLSASTAFILLIALVAAASALSVFFLLRQITGDDMVSASGMVVVLCLGCLVAYQGELRQLVEGRLLIDFFPFLRRYQPAFAFPLFFIFCTAVWRSLTREDAFHRRLAAAASGVLFAILVFSYFYIWTAAAIWLAGVSLLYFVLSKESRRRVLECVAITGAIGIVALIPYFALLANRNSTIDSIQLLSHTRAPEFASPAMWIGIITAVVIAFSVRSGKIKIDALSTTVALAFALTPVILLNQQIVTGRSLQPVHYEIFIANYMVLVALVLCIWGVLRSDTARLRQVFLYLGLIAFGWGIVEATFSTSRAGGLAEIRDGSIPAIQYIRGQESAGPVVVHATNFVTADFIPTVANVRPLWNPHTSSAGGVDLAENKRLFYLYLYYSGFGETDLAEALRANSFEVTAAIFGSERALPSLGSDAKRITQQEIAAEVAKYAGFARAFDEETAANPALSYIIVPADYEPNMSNLDRWYTRDAGQTFGLFKVYKLKLRSDQ
jgi:hypothetical protein